MKRKKSEESIDEYEIENASTDPITRTIWRSINDKKKAKRGPDEDKSVCFPTMINRFTENDKIVDV